MSVGLWWENKGILNYAPRTDDYTKTNTQLTECFPKYFSISSNDSWCWRIPSYSQLSVRLKTDSPCIVDEFQPLPMAIPCTESLELWQTIRDFLRSRNLEIVERFWSFSLAICRAAVIEHEIEMPRFVSDAEKMVCKPLCCGSSSIFCIPIRTIWVSIDWERRAIRASNFCNFHLAFRADIVWFWTFCWPHRRNCRNLVAGSMISSGAYWEDWGNDTVTASQLHYTENKNSYRCSLANTVSGVLHLLTLSQKILKSIRFITAKLEHASRTRYRFPYPKLPCTTKCSRTFRSNNFCSSSYS